MLFQFLIMDSKTVGSGFKSLCPCQNRKFACKMADFRFFVAQKFGVWFSASCKNASEPTVLTKRSPSDAVIFWDHGSFRATPHNGQGDLARDFNPAESSGNAGILCVFPYVPLNEKSTSCPLQGVHLHFQVSFCIPISVIFKNGHWGYLYAI